MVITKAIKLWKFATFFACPVSDVEAIIIFFWINILSKIVKILIDYIVDSKIIMDWIKGGYLVDLFTTFFVASISL